MFFNRFNDDERLSGVSMSPEEICRLATLNLAQIHEVAAAQMGDNTSVEAGLAILHMTANLCYPANYAASPPEAIRMVEEVLDLLPKRS